MLSSKSQALVLLFQLRLKISRSVFLAIGPRCFSTPSGPGAFFGLRFLMAEFSSEVFRVLFKHGLWIFSCFSSCLSFSSMSPTFFSVRGRVLSLLKSWANSFAAFLTVSDVLWTRNLFLERPCLTATGHCCQATSSSITAVNNLGDSGSPCLTFLFMGNLSDTNLSKWIHAVAWL